MLNRYLGAIPSGGKLRSASPALFSAFIFPLNFALFKTFVFDIKGLLDIFVGTSYK